MADVVQTTADIASKSIVGVNIVPSLITGIVVFFISLIVAHSIIAANKKEAKLDSSGCLLNTDGTRIEQNQYDNNGGLTGINRCVKPLSSLISYLIAIGISAIVGSIAGGIVYKIQFSIANPKLTAGIYTATAFTNAVTRRP